MKKLVKVVLAASIFLIPINKVDADSYPVYTKTISFNKNESINVNGKKYYDSGYVGTQRGLNKYDGLINDKYFNGRPDVRYKKGKDPNTIIVDMDYYTQIFVRSYFPKDKMPAEVYSASYKVKNINKGKNEIELSYLSGGGKTGTMFKNSKFLAELSEFDGVSLKVGDEIKLWHWFPTNGYEEMFIPAVYKIEKFTDDKDDISEEDSQKVLANKLFDNLVEAEAARTLISNLPSMNKEYKDKLSYSIKKSDAIINKGYKLLLTDKERLENDKSKAIIKIIQIKYDKKLEGDKDKTLALKTYDNMIMANAGKKLLNDYPNASKSIEKQLRASLDQSDQIVQKALKKIK